MKPLGRALAYLTASRFVLNTTHRMVTVFLPAIARGLGVSLESAGFLVSARWLAGVATPVLVATAGRGERRLRLAVWALVLFTTGAAVTAASGVYVGALVGFVLMGLGKPAFDTASMAYVADRTPYDKRARYLTVMELTWSFSLLIGAPFVGWLMERRGWSAPLWVAAVAGTVALVGARRFLGIEGSEDRGPTAPLRLNRSALALLATFVAFSLGSEITFVVYGAWLEDSFGLSLVGLGSVSIAIAIAELVGAGSVLAFADRVGKRRMAIFGLIGCVLGYLTLSTVTHSLVLGIIVFSAVLIAFEITIISGMPLASEVVPKGRARFLAILLVFTNIGRTVGASVGPFLYREGGMSLNVVVSSGAMLIALVVMWRMVREG